MVNSITSTLRDPGTGPGTTSGGTTAEHPNCTHDRGHRAVPRIGVAVNASGAAPHPVSACGYHTSNWSCRWGVRWWGGGWACVVGWLRSLRGMDGPATPANSHRPPCGVGTPSGIALLAKKNGWDRRDEWMGSPGKIDGPAPGVILQAPCGSR